jgi:hypothetical protein
VGGAWSGLVLLPGYRHLIEQGEGQVDTAAPLRLVELIDEIGAMAGQYLWSLAILGGSAWKMEGCLTAFCRRHQLVPVVVENTQVLLRGLPGTEPVLSAHAVESLDWYRPTAGEISPNSDAEGRTGVRHREVAAAREEAERAVRAALRDRPRLLARFDGLPGC